MAGKTRKSVAGMGCPVHVGGGWKAPSFALIPGSEAPTGVRAAVRGTSTERTVGFVILRKHLLFMGTWPLSGWLSPAVQDQQDPQCPGKHGALSVRVAEGTLYNRLELLLDHFGEVPGSRAWLWTGCG